jgi:precorrin-6B methylase 1
METLLNIAENSNNIVITIDKRHEPQKAAEMLAEIRRLSAMMTIEYVSDEEQREIEQILASQTEEEKEIAFIGYATIDLP